MNGRKISKLCIFWKKNVFEGKSLENLRVNAWKVYSYTVTKLIKRTIVKQPQCGNYKLFLSLRKSVFGILEVQSKICHFISIRGSKGNTSLMNFCNLCRLTFTKIIKSHTPKMVKTAVLKYLVSAKLISRKIWMAEKSWNFYTVARQQAYLVVVKGFHAVFGS